MTPTKRKTIYKCHVGSIAHNLYVAPSMDKEFGTCDKDYMEFYVYDKDYYLGLDGYHRRGDTFELKKGDVDLVGHELRKAFDLMLKGNPNILVTLFNDPSNYIELTDGAKMILHNRSLFLSARNMKMRFAGYAYSQLHRMQKAEYAGYMGKKRKAIVDKYGYDTKNAMTLVRLLQEGIELLKTGKLVIYKTGTTRDFLLDIKRAKFTLKEVQEMADNLFADLDKAYSESVLPELLNGRKINKLLIDILDIEVFSKP